MSLKTTQLDWSHSHLLGIRELSAEDIHEVHTAAFAFKEVIRRRIKKVPVLRGRTVVNLFVEPSTRTRVSFELAAQRLSADVLNFDVSASSFKKGESLLDTVLNIEALQADIIVLRHPDAGAAHLIARHLNCSVINAGDGAHEHPTQALLDTFTLVEKLGDIRGLPVLISGDIAHSRVARSLILALKRLGAEVTLCGPATLLPKEFKDFGVTITHDFDSALTEAHVIYLLRIQHERQQAGLFPGLGEFITLYGMTEERLKRCRKDVIIMHPGPINRGVELPSSIADGPHSLVLEQVTNGLAVRMAVLHLLNHVRLKNEPASHGIKNADLVPESDR